MKFTVNTDLSGYSDEEIAELLTQGNGALDELFAVESPTEEQFQEASDVNGHVARLQAEQDARATAANERATQWATLRDSRVTAAREDAEEDDDDSEVVEEEADDAEQDAPPAVEPAVEAAVQKPAPARTTARAALAGNRPAQKPAPARKPITLTAAADVQGFAAGSSIADMATLGNAVVNRMGGFPQPEGVDGGAMHKFSVAQFYKPYEDEVMVKPGQDGMAALAAAVDESRLPGKSLMASGGWCAPSETLYDFCFNSTPEGLLSLPEVAADRGGVRFTTGPDFATLYTSTGFQQTEAQAISGTAKGCYEVVCPTFTEVRLDAIGLCIKVPILTNAAYPELVQATIAGSLLAHQHRVSAYLIGKMVTASGSAVVPSVVGGVSANTLDGLEHVANGLRQDYRLPFDAIIEGTAPFWLRSAIRADLANRTGVDLLSVTNAMVDAYLAVRFIRIQWVYNWQPLVANEEGYPTTVQVMLWPAGTFVKAATNVINLSAVYDAASLNVNTYTGLFMEEGVALIQRCYKSKLVTLTVDASGRTGAANITAPFNLT